MKIKKFNHWDRSVQILPLLLVSVASIANRAEANEPALHTQAMIAVGATDREEVLQNLTVYQNILHSVKLEAKDKTHYHSTRQKNILNSLNDLDQRLNAQISFISWVPGASTALIPSLKDSIERTRTAILNYNYDQVVHEATHGSDSMNEIRKELK